MLRSLGISAFEIRQKQDLSRHMDGLILPGGESTAMGKLLRDTGMLRPLQEKVKHGMPVLATCAGLILLAERLEGSEAAHLATLPVTVKRNAYGRQLGSFQCRAEVRGIGTVPMTFIRAPYIADAGPEVEILSVVDGNIVAVEYKNQLAMSFHPELTESAAIHRRFAERIGSRQRA